MSVTMHLHVCLCMLPVTGTAVLHDSQGQLGKVRLVQAMALSWVHGACAALTAAVSHLPRLLRP